MKRVILPVLFLLLACFTGIVTAQTPEPTQTPYIIYVVITATPEPEVLQNVPEDTTILRLRSRRARAAQQLQAVHRITAGPVVRWCIWLMDRLVR